MLFSCVKPKNNFHMKKKLVAGKGFEPLTSGLWAQRAGHCSTPQFVEILGLILDFIPYGKRLVLVDISFFNEQKVIVYFPYSFFYCWTLFLSLKLYSDWWSALFYTLLRSELIFYVVTNIKSLSYDRTTHQVSNLTIGLTLVSNSFTCSDNKTWWPIWLFLSSTYTHRSGMYIFFLEV